MLIRRKTLERLLTDRDRAGVRDRQVLLEVIAAQNDRLMFLAGSQYAATPLQDGAGDPGDDDVAESFPDPEQLPDDLGPDPY